MATMVETLAPGNQIHHVAPQTVSRARFLMEASVSSVSLNSPPNLNSSSTSLSSRKIRQKHARSESQMLRTGLQTPMYTILGDPPPWAEDEAAPPPIVPLRRQQLRDAVPSSIYSSDTPYFDPMGSENARMQPLHIRIPPQPAYSYNRQENIDPAPKLKSSRLPIFKQVRSMLQRQSPTSPQPNNTEWERTVTGVQAHDNTNDSTSPRQNVIHPAYRSVPPLMSDFESLRSRSASPVSILRGDEIQHGVHFTYEDVDEPASPVSAVSSISRRSTSSYAHPRTSLSIADLRSQANLPSGLNKGWGQFRRKPMPGSANAALPISQADSYLQHTLSPHAIPNQLDNNGIPLPSRISWSTYAQSTISSRAPPSTMSSPQSDEHEFVPTSRFSWTTVGTGTTWQTRPATMASSIILAVPRVPVSSYYSSTRSRTYDGAADDQYHETSVLARGRPVKRHDEYEEATRSKKPIAALHIHTSPVASSSRRSTPTGSSDHHKALPLPPELQRPESPLTHIDSLLVQERDLALQRSNIWRGIKDVERLQKASPLEVSFATVRDAKKRMVEYRTRLNEVEREQREIGILISRARRKEGVEEGLWVRRVTS